MKGFFSKLNLFPRVILFIFQKKFGGEYGISPFIKANLIFKIIRNTKKIRSYTRWQEHLVLIAEILKLPKSLKGDVVECGCYKGAATASLSLACALVNRRLIACDSFSGLPEAKDDEAWEVIDGNNKYYSWRELGGSLKASLDEATENVKNFGEISVCKILKGYFKDVLKNIGNDPIVLVFEDADLPSSVRDCLRYLWPNLQNGCYFYSHEPWSVKVVSLFFDRKWWQSNFGTEPPGFYGYGWGLNINICHTLGCAIKYDRTEILKYGSPRRGMKLGNSKERRRFIDSLKNQNVQ